MNLMMTNKEGNPCTSRTIFWYGALICLVRLAFSGFDLGFIQIPVFSGTDFAVALGALGGIRTLDKHITNIK